MSAMNGWLCGAICGAGTMYFFDPEQGRRRRALLRDQIDRMAHRLPEDLDAAWRDLTNRAYGTVAEAGSCFSAHDDSDAVVCERVRSKAGRYLTHPSALQVDVADGCVTLCGPILANEVQPLIQAVRSVRGVCSVDNQLDVHESAGNISALQGAGQRPGEPFELMQANVSPGIRLLAGAAGGMLLANCLIQRTTGSMLLGLAGFALLSRSLGDLGMTAAMGSARPAGRRQAGGKQAQGSIEGERKPETSSPNRSMPREHEIAEPARTWPDSQPVARHQAEEADRFPPSM